MIKIKDCKTVELSVDLQSNLFFCRDRVFRAINSDYIDEVKEMFKSGFIDEVIEKKLFPKTWISEEQIENYALVIEHEYINHWNYPYEWSFSMLKDAAQTVLDINRIANKYGYEIMDGHSYNVVFNMNKPQYIDLGSFIKKSDTKNNWSSYRIFYNHFYIPLDLWSNNYSNIARNIFLMEDDFNEIEFLRFKYKLLNKVIKTQFIIQLINNSHRLALSSYSKINIKLKNKTFKKHIALLLFKLLKNSYTSNRIEQKILKLHKPIEKSMWNDYHNDIIPEKNERFIRIKEIINSLTDVTSAIELASNQGKFAKFILDNTHIKQIIATDYDKEAVDIMYINNKNSENFLPLLFDFVRTNGRKYDEHIYTRIKSDLVIALAVTHHLLLTQNISIEFIFKTMKRLTNKYIIVEFMPIGLYGGNIDTVPSLPNYYNLDWFKDNFNLHFDLILDEKLEFNRHLFVGRLK